MIAQLTGVVVEKRDGAVVLDVNGVGYLVHVSQTSLAALPPGERARLRTYTHVREDALDLFGFATEEEEAVFGELIGVKNVGPRAALHILSGIEPREFAAAVASGDVARLTKVPGIGKKTAERLVLELKEKLVALARVAAPRAGERRAPRDRAARAGAHRPRLPPAAGRPGRRRRGWLRRGARARRPAPRGAEAPAGLAPAPRHSTKTVTVADGACTAVKVTVPAVESGRVTAGALPGTCTS